MKSCDNSIVIKNSSRKLFDIVDEILDWKKYNINGTIHRVIKLNEGGVRWWWKIAFDVVLWYPRQGMLKEGKTKSVRTLISTLINFKYYWQLVNSLFSSFAALKTICWLMLWFVIKNISLDNFSLLHLTRKMFIWEQQLVEYRVRRYVSYCKTH